MEGENAGTGYLLPMELDKNTQREPTGAQGEHVYTLAKARYIQPGKQCVPQNSPSLPGKTMLRVDRSMVT